MTAARGPDSVRRRLVVLTGSLSAVLAVGLVVVVQVVLGGASTDAVDRVLADRADAVVSSARASSDSVPEVPAAVLDPGVAVYDATSSRVAGFVPPSLQDAFDELSTSSTEASLQVEDDYTVMARPFAVGSGSARADGVVVLAEPLAPYERDERAALAVSVAAGALMVALGVLVAAWISRRALAPVQTMADTAREWSEHDLERRFGLGPPTDEIRALGQTLDELLDKVAAAIRAEQRLTAELAHELRSPLTSVQATAELMAMRTDLDDQLREDVDDVLAGCREMASTMTVLLEIARRQAAGDPGETCTAVRLADAVREQVPDERLEVELGDGWVAHAPVAVVLRALTPVLDNALQVADDVRLTTGAGLGAGTVTLRVSDDGPGIDPAAADRIFEPGTTDRAGIGSGLGLALARRVARSAGGDVALSDDLGPGATFVITLPGRVGDDRSLG